MNNEYTQHAGGVTQSPELSLDFSDQEILDLIDRKISEYNAFYTKKKIKERTEKMVRYCQGNQVGASTDKSDIDLDSQYINNIIHRDLNKRARNATSRLPDIVVMSPQQQKDLAVRDQTQNIEQWLKIRLDSDVLKRLAKNALLDNHRKLRGIWKYRYDHFKKDAIIDRLRPEDVILDSTARIPEDGFTADNMEFIGEWIEEPTASVIAKFPDKKDEILDELDREKSQKGDKARSSKMRYLEVWATMHDDSGAPHEMLVHKYNNILLSKGPNPYFDESGENEQEFGIIPESDLSQNPLDQLQEILGGQPQMPQALMPQKPKRKNHFAWARKPYTIWSGENEGNGPLDDTTVVEVTIPLQNIVNKRGNQITLINDWAVPKVVTSQKYMSEEKAENITRDPTEIIVLSGDTEDVRSGITTINGNPASPALYNDLQQAIASIDSHFDTNPIHEATGESGLSKQISREDDLASADDISETMIQRAVEEAANWLVQLAKIYFDKPVNSFTRGNDRSIKSAAISSDMIPDDIQIIIMANAIDKTTKRNLDMNLASMKAIDPFTLYEDLDFPNPKEMTKRLVDFLNGPPSGYVNYMQDVGINPVQPANQQSEGADQQQEAPQPGQPPIPPNQPQLANPISQPVQ